MKVLDASPPPVRDDRPASAVLHDHPDLRAVAFHLAPGQTVPPHHSASTVTVHVVSGRGTFTGAGGEAVLAPGESAVYAPAETHAIRAGDQPLHFIALITPRPG
jgi:quercetin dioxygenase-like cupin family protein